MQVKAVALICLLILAADWSVVNSTRQLTCYYDEEQENDVTGRGVAGPPGEPGRKGEKGDRGRRGRKGEDGDPSISREELTRMETRVVALERQSLLMIGRLGEQGEKGNQGKQGKKGDKGESIISREELEQIQTKLATLERQSLLLEGQLAVVGKHDCSDVAIEGFTADGVYNISMRGNIIEVYCDLEKNGGHWLVFQKRYSGAVDFYKNWNNYKYGFGDKREEFWLGLENLHQITSRRSYKLRIDLEDWQGNTTYAEYSSFSVGNESSNYRLNVGSYSGTAGDSLSSSHNNMPFSTKDKDTSNGRCVTRYHGAWWYNNCYTSNLNGRYVYGGASPNRQGMEWQGWRNSYSVKKSEMKIRPV